MKICIVIQSDAFRDSAGMRIRYDRFREKLDPLVATIETATVAELSASKTFEHDAYVFCKTFDIAALLLARRIRLSRKVVGQDLFDDYFSQTADPRLQRYRDWMRDMAPVTDFAICSTPRMAEVIRSYLPSASISVVEDPIVGLDAARVACVAEAKVDEARTSRVLKVSWFGIGDNPLFPVGLTDLATCESELALMERLGWTVQLSIVTNRRAFEGAGAEGLRRLSGGFKVVEWTEESEQIALSEATVAIIPVNGQSFSRAKSLNRAITALHAGCQVLSIGYPLYERLAPLIYRSADELIEAIANRRPRLRAETAGALEERISALADPTKAAHAFVNEAQRPVQAARPKPQGPTCVLHGLSSTISTHKSVGAIGGLSVKTIFCKAPWNFPVRFDQQGSGIVMLVTAQVADRFALPVTETSEPERIGDFDFVRVDQEKLGLRSLHMNRSLGPNPLLNLALYADVMAYAEEGCAAAFPGADVLVSDSSPLSLRPPRLNLPSKPPNRRKAGVQPPAGGHRPSAAVQSHRWTLRKIARLPRRQQGTRSERELLEQSPLFNVDWYLARYPDVAASGQDPIAHYLDFGWREGRNPGPGFSTRKYLKANDDVAAKGLNPLVHYLEHGQSEGRKAPLAEKGASSR
jgi:hypothetical protein